MEDEPRWDWRRPKRIGPLLFRHRSLLSMSPKLLVIPRLILTPSGRLLLFSLSSSLFFHLNKVFVFPPVEWEGEILVFEEVDLWMR